MVTAIKYILLITFFMAASFIHFIHAQHLPLIIDTDANNEIDDQHALAYVLLNQKVFDVKGITVNATYNGGDIDQHLAEALRVVKLCGAEDKIKVLKGADQNFEKIRSYVKTPVFDGYEAVNFIISEANQIQDQTGSRKAHMQRRKTVIILFFCFKTLKN